MIIANNDILKGGNHAGKLGGSTFQPIRIINNIIEDAILEKNNDLIIFFQDLSKAYDRVDITILEKALIRIKIPKITIRFIINLFKNRKNNILTCYGNTEYYDVLTGIDQGEAISPLLWTIYLDPLLTKINKLELGYEIKYKRMIDTYGTRSQDLPNDEIRINIPTQSYMDDITWLSLKMKNLERRSKYVHEQSLQDIQDITTI